MSCWAATEGFGCEVCKPTIGSLLASCRNDLYFATDLVPLQDTNDNFLANMRKGTAPYFGDSALTGGEITRKVCWLSGLVAQGISILYQNCQLHSAFCDVRGQKQDLPYLGKTDRRQFETGTPCRLTADGENLCRRGMVPVLESVTAPRWAALSWNRYQRYRTPHKMKFISGCWRLPEAQRERYRLSPPTRAGTVCLRKRRHETRHGDLLMADPDKETLIRYIDRFMMFYIRTADKLSRTSTGWKARRAGLITCGMIVGDKLELNAASWSRNWRSCAKK